MAEFLFVTWDGGGNVPPALGIAAELQGRGHAVRFLGHETQREAIGAAGFGFASFPTAKPFSSLESNAPPRIMALFTDKAIGADAVSEARRRPTDVVVVDCMMIGALRACADAGLTYVTLEHLFDRLDDIRIDEAEHGPPDARRYRYTDSWILRGTEALHLEFTALA